ncbi:sperm-associated antigen 1-like [Cloeon dipterum]|uniref:sperm-associated antigen 1-like n=1 Tax=Cloeon dipterum TaxID=197152 RepID=UPI00321FEBF3
MDIVNEIPAVVDADKWVEVWKEAGDKRLRLKEYDNAFVCYCKALGYCPNNLYCLVKRFYLLMLSRNYKNALTAGRRVVELDPTNVKCLIGIAKCCVNLGDVVSAEDAVEQASNIEPDNPAFKKLRNDIEMIICLTKQVIDALKTGAHKKQLMLWILSGNEDKDHSYKRAKRLNKKIVKIQLYIDEGNKCIEQKKPVVAKGWFKKALTVDPYNKMLNSKLLCTLADIYAHQKCLGRAIDCCSDALKLDPENRRALKT